MAAPLKDSKWLSSVNIFKELEKKKQLFNPGNAESFQHLCKTNIWVDEQ